MNGILIVNKPSNYTSHDIVYKVKRITGMKVGHTGTLDPMATGVLPLLIGKGTLCSKYLINHDKIYNVKLQLGIKTDTADSEGNIIEQKEVKDKPTITEFSYNEETENQNKIKAKFVLNDNEQTIVNGKIIITDKNKNYLKMQLKKH